MASINNLPQDLLDKIKKLKNLEEGAREVGSIAEAANAGAKMQALLLKYNLSMEDLDQHELKAKISMLRDDIDLTEFYAWKASQWVDRLVRGVARFCMCEAVGVEQKRQTTKIAILGEKQNVAMVFYFIEQVTSKIKIAFNIEWMSHDDTEENMRIFRRSFLTGAVDVILSKLREGEKESIKSETGMEVMIIDKRKAATAFKDQEFGNSLVSTKPRAGARTSKDGYLAGVKAGRGITLDKGVGGGSQKRLGNS